MLNQLKGVFKSFQENDVKYLVMGGIAAILYGVPRATFDLDILIKATPDNTRRLLKALLDAGLGTAAMITAQEILANEITVFNDIVRIDVQTSTPGITFEKAWENRRIMKYQEQEFIVISKEELVASKSAAGRKVDIDDVRALSDSE